VTGAQGLNGIQGATGIKGATGVVGATGLEGITGVQGATGIQGQSGLFGDVLITDSSLTLSTVGSVITIGTSADVASGNTVANQTVSWANGTSQSWTLNVATTTFTFTNPLSGATHVLVLAQSSSGNNAVVWPTVKWAGGVTPPLSTAPNAIDIATFVYDGTNYYGSIRLNFH
jgi:hypothetical protein